MAALTNDDIARHQALGIPPELLDEAGVFRVSDAEARDLLSSRRPGDLAGVAYPYLDPVSGTRLTYRLRRDHPEMEAGKPRDKYLSAYGDSKRLFFPPGAAELLSDTSVLVVIVEAEKSVLAVTAAARRAGCCVLAIGAGGAWGWRGRTGKATDASGARVDEKGPLPDLNRVTWLGRVVVILFDANAASNASVQAARQALAQHLTERGALVRIANLPVEEGINGPDDYVGKHGDAALFSVLDNAGCVAGDDERRRGNGRRSQATQLVDLALASGVELWHAPGGEPYFTVRVGGHREHHPLRRIVRDYLAREFYTATSRSASSAALADALATLSGMARYDGPTFPVGVRHASDGGRVYLDLGDPEWRSVAIDADGCQVVADAPVHFWRPAALRGLPVPVPGGALDAFREVFALDDDTWTLVASWLVAALAPRGPYPALAEIGEAGAGKSTLGRMVRGMIDPAAPELRGVPRDERDLMIGALTSHVVALDNLSGLQPWLSDALCRIATGGGLATRTLYSDLDETLIDVMRPILLTGIEQPATRGDLLDRLLVVTLPAIDDRVRSDEADLWLRYRAMLPALLGALCDAVSEAMRNVRSIRLPRRPRMADACGWVTAAAPALGWADDRVARAWLGSREAASADLLAGDPVALALLAIPQDRLPWTGIAADLLSLLDGRASEAVRTSRHWPRSPRGLSGALRRLAPDLRRSGLDVNLPTDARTARERLITIRRVCAEPDEPDVPDIRSALSANPAAWTRPVGGAGEQPGPRQDAPLGLGVLPASEVSDLSGPVQAGKSRADDGAGDHADVERQRQGGVDEWRP